MRHKFSWKRLRKNLAARQLLSSVLLLSLSSALFLAAIGTGDSLGWSRARNNTIEISNGGINAANSDTTEVGFDVFYYDKTLNRGVMKDAGGSNTDNTVSLNIYDKLFDQNNEKTSVILRALVYGYDSETLMLHLNGEDVTLTKFVKNSGTSIYTGNYLSNVINVKAAVIPGLADEAAEAAAAAVKAGESTNSEDYIEDYIYTHAVAEFAEQEYTLDENGNFVADTTTTSSSYDGGIGRFVRFGDMPDKTVVNSVTVTDIGTPSSANELLIKSGSTCLRLNGAKLDKATFNYTGGTYTDTTNDSGTLTSDSGTKAKEAAVYTTSWKFEDTGNGYQISAASGGTRHYLSLERASNGAVSLGLSTDAPAIWTTGSNGSLYTYLHSVSYDEGNTATPYAHTFTFYSLCYDGTTWTLAQSGPYAVSTSSITEPTISSSYIPSGSAASGTDMDYQKIEIADSTVISGAATPSDGYNKVQSIDISVSHIGSGSYDSGNRLFVYVQIDYDKTLVNKYFNVNNMSMILSSDPIPFSEKFTFTLN